MAPEVLAATNALLADPPELDFSVSQRLGFHVVARLAARHGINVVLSATPGSGVTALVRIPAMLTTEPSDRPSSPITGPLPVTAGRTVAEWAPHRWRSPCRTRARSRSPRRCRSRDPTPRPGPCRTSRRGTRARPRLRARCPNRRPRPPSFPPRGRPRLPVGRRRLGRLVGTPGARTRTAPRPRRTPTPPRPHDHRCCPRDGPSTLRPLRTDAPQTRRRATLRGTAATTAQPRAPPRPPPRHAAATHRRADGLPPALRRRVPQTHLVEQLRRTRARRRVGRHRPRGQGRAGRRERAHPLPGRARLREHRRSR